jgi:hypothetical protein
MRPAGHAYEMMRPDMAAQVAGQPQSPMDVTPSAPGVPAQYVPEAQPVVPPGETPNSDVQRPDVGAPIPVVPAETPATDAQRPTIIVPAEVAPAKPAETPMPLDEKK